jgi:CelD/BcsL family acetyltransferase involved in cellulose biosynthesis
MRACSSDDEMPAAADAPPVAGAGASRPAGKADALFVTVHRDLEGADHAWRALQTRPHVSIHQTYEWCRAWVESMDADPLVIVGHRQVGPVFVLPLEVNRRGGARVARFIATPFSNVNFGVFDETFADDPPSGLAAALAEALRHGAPDIDLLCLERMPARWRDVDNPFFCLPSTESQNRAFQTTLHPAFDTVLGQVNARKRRKKQRLVQRRLEEMGGYAIVHADTGADGLALLDAFFAQKARRFRSQGKLDVFDDAKVRAFFRQLVRQGAGERDRLLRLSAVRLADGRIGAIAGVSHKDGHYICQFGSIDEEIGASLSIGEFLFYHLLEDACVPGAAMFDFGIGDESYKRSWCDRETIHRNAFLALSVKGRIAAAGLAGLTRAKRIIKTSPRLDRAARVLQRLVNRR